MRIKDHPILDFKRERKINFTFDGQQIEAYQGETIVAALHAAGIKKLSKSSKFDRPRGLFCSIGKCSSCLMTVDGIPNVKACVTLAKEGMDVQSQRGRGKLNPRKVGTNPKKSSQKINAELTIVGSGPAGLSAAKTSLKHGISPLLVDENPKPGGQLVKQTHKFFGSKKQEAGTRGFHIADELRKEIESTNFPLLTGLTLVGVYKNDEEYFTMTAKDDERLYIIETPTLIVATGAMEKMLVFPNNDLPGVYGAGAVQTLMNVYGIKPGKRALMIGAGNVGLIVSYQLLQAGVEVEAVVEAMPNIGGYHVHAAKLRRFGIPILTSHSIKEALGNREVEGAVVVKVDEDFHPLDGTERKFDVDIICLAVGLSPSTQLVRQAGCKCTWISELGGQVPLHNQNLQITMKGIYVAGDSAGIGEASTAMIEGKIAALSALYDMGNREVIQPRKEALKELANLRAGPYGEMARKGKRKVFWKLEEVLN